MPYVYNDKEHQYSLRASLIGLGVLVALVILMALSPGQALGAMENNLTNQACLTCHTGYPGTQTNIKHEWSNCGTCHTNKAVESMWNCRYCHISRKFKGGSSYYLHKNPTLSEGMNRHSWDGSLRYIDATFTTHDNNLATKHTSTETAGCLSCHHQSLTEEHSGGTVIKKEDFEDTAYNLTFTGSWYRNNAYPYAGSYSFRSATIPDNTTTSMETTINLAQDGKVSFWYRVSSETNYDMFYFYIDGVQKLGDISGNTGWLQATYPLTSGTHTLKWAYIKDLYVQEFEDSVFIDDIVIYNGGRALDCNTCHMSSTATVKTAIANDNKNCSGCHPNTDHQGRHSTTIAADCAECHSNNLVNEHDSRTDDQGNAYTCDTCHKSADPQVIDAINTNNKDCAACHGPGPINHDLPHASGMDNECLNCHTQYLNTDHKAFNVSCGQCHNSTVASVTWAVQTGDRYCGSCHGDSHGVPLDYKNPTDIPLYNGLDWSTPMAVQIWQSESWVPSKVGDLGKVIVSERGTVSGDTIWNFYKTEMPAKGWTLASTEPAVGASDFQAEYSKEGRTCIIWFHSKEDRVSNKPDLGAKVEVIYN